MKIRLKKRGFFGVKRINLDVHIDRVRPLMDRKFPEVRSPTSLVKNKKKIKSKDNKSGISIYFKGIEGVGVLSLSPKETEKILKKTLSNVVFKNSYNDV